MDPEKKSLNFIFPTKYVIPKSLSRLAIGQVSKNTKRKRMLIITAWKLHNGTDLKSSKSVGTELVYLVTFPYAHCSLRPSAPVVGRVVGEKRVPKHRA